MLFNCYILAFAHSKQTQPSSKWGPNALIILFMLLLLLLLLHESVAFSSPTLVFWRASIRLRQAIEPRLMLGAGGLLGSASQVTCRS
ncbi:hypothetical protein B0T19DRAFT_433036 [Cercophora scortea]|uniref:Uncharacterized protein n=1 Tax=Cercophora scortea TaxID=314031 RepID=A0AAE0M598_9PEZI|nr:hypothetical protein B0T19DRAFT_433036 [Cercophora scortea]